MSWKKKPSPPRTDLVLGMSSSEVAGGQVEKPPTLTLPKLVQTLLDELNPRGIYLAVQGCEHLNRCGGRRELADKRSLEIVNVLPSLHAGGAGQLAAFKYFVEGSCGSGNSSQLKQG